MILSTGCSATFAMILSTGYSAAFAMILSTGYIATFAMILSTGSSATFAMILSIGYSAAFSNGRSTTFGIHGYVWVLSLRPMSSCRALFNCNTQPTPCQPRVTNVDVKLAIGSVPKSTNRPTSDSTALNILHDAVQQTCSALQPG